MGSDRDHAAGNVAALSIGAGRIKPSTILRRLATYSRKNKLDFAFRELGRVVRTVSLLDYISDIELRRTIQAATNKFCRAGRERENAPKPTSEGQ